LALKHAWREMEEREIEERETDEMAPKRAWRDGVDERRG